MDSVYPPVMAGARQASYGGQKIFMRLTGATLILSCLAAFGGAVPVEMRAGEWDLDLGALFGALAFVAGLAVTLVLLQSRPEERWYQGRASAESIKTLSWQYCVGGGSYPKSLPDADAKWIDQLKKVILELPATGHSGAGLTVGQITAEMHAHRAATLADRQKLYREHRIENQRKWYADKAAEAVRKSTMWLWVTIGAQLAGAALALVKGIGLWDVDLLGIFAAIAASAAGWAQTKQYQVLASSYEFTAKELLAIQAEAPIRLVSPDEAKWAEFVEDAETAISREHTTWRARRGIA